VSELAGKTALVTGASGFIGTALARRLRRDGVTVCGLSRRSPSDSTACDRWWFADVTDLDEVRRVLDAVRPDLVFHLASVVSGSRAMEAVVPTMQSNLVSAVNLLIAATERPVERILLAGSQEEGRPDGNWPVPASPYAAAKLAAGAYARMFHALYGTPTVWLRLFMVYGPGQRDTSKLIPYAAVSLLNGVAPAVSSGSRLVDWIYIDDAVDAIRAAATTLGLEGRTLDIGSGASFTLRHVLEQLARLAGTGVEPLWGAETDRPLELDCVADAEATATSLGWRARTPLSEGLRRTLDWYRARESDEARQAPTR
jgi:nucleoside-diphosphate-sugar epimerase